MAGADCGSELGYSSDAEDETEVLPSEADKSDGDIMGLAVVDAHTEAVRPAIKTAQTGSSSWRLTLEHGSTTPAVSTQRAAERGRETPRAAEQRAHEALGSSSAEATESRRVTVGAAVPLRPSLSFSFPLLSFLSLPLCLSVSLSHLSLSGVERRWSRSAVVTRNAKTDFVES